MKKRGRYSRKAQYFKSSTESLIWWKVDVLYYRNLGSDILDPEFETKSCRKVGIFIFLRTYRDLRQNFTLYQPLSVRKNILTMRSNEKFTALEFK